MVDGIHLTLLIGFPLPLVPAPRKAVEALTNVQVTMATGGSSAFQLTFDLTGDSPLQTLFMIAGGITPPLVRVVLVATVNGVPEVLIDGVTTNHEVSPGSGSGQTTLSVTGEDLSRVMDYIDLSGLPYPAMPPAVRVLTILAKYAILGIVPMVIPSVLVDVPVPVDRIPRQNGKDLGYVRSLAREVGYVFYIDPGPAPGMSVAYWGPEIKVGVPQPALNVDMDAHTNVESVSFSYDSESKTLPIVFIQNQQTRVPIPIPIPDISPLNPPLGAVTAIPKRIEPIYETAKYSPVRGALIGLAKAAQSADLVSASGTLDVTRYGRVLKPRKLVGVRGAGLAFDGLYYVKTVTHNLKPGEYKQNFTLSRNGLVSILPRVPV